MKFLTLLLLVSCVDVGDCLQQRVVIGNFDYTFNYTVTKVTDSEVFLEESEWKGNQPYTYSIDPRLLEFYTKVDKKFCDKDVED